MKYLLCLLMAGCSGYGYKKVEVVHINNNESISIKKVQHHPGIVYERKF